MKPLFTRTGDDGTTGLPGNKRVAKSNLQIEVLGSLDELSAFLGLARSLNDQNIGEVLKEIQIRIFEIMSEIAASNDNNEKLNKIDDETVLALEKLVEKYSADVQLPNAFILPGDNQCSAAISVARVTARRAERRLVELSKLQPSIRNILVKYLNRLSSFLYILEIYVIQSQANGIISLAKKKAK